MHPVKIDLIGKKDPKEADKKAKPKQKAKKKKKKGKAEQKQKRKIKTGRKKVVPE